MQVQLQTIKNRFSKLYFRQLMSNWRLGEFDLSGQAISKTATYGVMTFALLAAIGLTASFMDLFNYSLWLPISYIIFLLAVAIFVICRIDMASQDLKRHHTLLREAFEFAPAGRLIADEKGHTIYVNAAFKKLFDFEEDISLSHLASLFDSDSQMADLFTQLLSRTAKGEASEEELFFYNKSNEKRWLHIKAMPVWEHYKTSQWRIEDITKRKKIQTKIQEEQSKLSDYLNHAPVGFYAVNGEGHFLFINETLAKWLECEPEQMINSELKLHDFFVDDYTTHAPYTFTKGQENYQQGQVVMKSRSGKVFRASINQTLVRDEKGIVIKTRSIVRDLTPEQEWQQALRQSHQRFEYFFQSAPNGIALVNQQGEIDECNKAFASIVKIKKEDLLKKNFIELFKEKDRALLTEKMNMTLKGEEALYPIELELEGEVRNIQLFAKCLDLGDVHDNVIIFHIIDHTEQKNLEVQFAQSQKIQAIGQLAGGVAHDFNNLLTAMIGFCDLLLNRHKPGDPSFADLMQIKQNANRGANLVKQLLAFSRKQTLKPRMMNVTEVLADLSNLLSRLIGEQIQLNMYHGRDLGLVKVDQGQLEQVIINLAVNARDAMKSGGILDIRTSHILLKKTLKIKPDDIPPGEYVCIEVIDNGSGISKENIELIFDPFFSTKEVGAGTGLGLSTVYGIIRQSKGYVRVESEIDKGSQFIIYLPYIAQDQKKTQVSPVEKEKKIYDLTGGETILLVEDEDPVRLFSSRALKNKGYEVIEACNGEMALSILQENKDRIDLLISDVVMPNIDGPTLYQHVSKIRPDLKFIFISGYAEDRFQDQFETMDEINFLPKPFTLKQLAEKVKDVLGEYHRLKAETKEKLSDKSKAEK